MDRWSVGILVFPQVEVLDFAGPFEVFSRTRLEPGVESRRSEESAPFSVFTVAKTRDAIETTGGLKIVPQYGFADAPRIDLLVVPGGFGTRALLEDSETLEWIRSVAAKARQTTSVCTGALLLAKAGLLQGRRATTHWAALDLLASLGAGVQVVRDARVVHDGIISSAGVAAGHRHGLRCRRTDLRPIRRRGNGAVHRIPVARSGRAQRRLIPIQFITTECIYSPRFATPKARPGPPASARN